MSFTVRAAIFQTPEPGELAHLDDHVVTVDDAGVIADVAPFHGAMPVDVTLPAGTYLLPGLIDTHIHAPQWPQLGTGLDLPLERWLFEHTFPLEARFADEGFARRVWSSLVPSLLGRGTTTAVYYASIHEPATLALAEACVEHGQRALVGRVAMDHAEETPEWYRDPGALASVEASHRSITAITALQGGGGLVEPIVTPRFIPACSDAALEGLGELAASTGTRIQTHCSESDWEHAYVLDRHGRSDTRSLHRFGLVADHTVLAHGTHLDADDRRLLVESGAGVAHCPLSNAYFSHAVFHARRALDAGMRIGLGTDVAGGAEPSLLAQCHHAVTSSRMLSDGVDASRPGRGSGEGHRIGIATAFWMATLGGAELIGVPAGLLAPGRSFDAFAVATGAGTGVDLWDDVDDQERIFEKIVRRSTPADIRHVWVGGREVTPSLAHSPAHAAPR